MSNQNDGMAAALTVGWVGGLPADGHAARTAKSMLDNCARTLSGVSVDRAEKLRLDYLTRAGRADKASKGISVSVKSKGGVDSAKSVTDFAQAGIRPPVLSALNEAAQHVFKLRALGAFPAEETLTVDVDKVAATAAARWPDLE